MIWKRSVQASTTVTTEFLVQKATGAAWRLSQETGMRRKSNQPLWDEETAAISPPVSTPSRPRWQLRYPRRRHTFLRRLLCPAVPSTPTELATRRVVVAIEIYQRLRLLRRHETPKKDTAAYQMRSHKKSRCSGIGAVGPAMDVSKFIYPSGKSQSKAHPSAIVNLPGIESLRKSVKVQESYVLRPASLIHDARS